MGNNVIFLENYETDRFSFPHKNSYGLKVKTFPIFHTTRMPVRFSPMNKKLGWNISNSKSGASSVSFKVIGLPYVVGSRYGENGNRESMRQYKKWKSVTMWQTNYGGRKRREIPNPVFHVTITAKILVIICIFFYVCLDFYLTFGSRNNFFTKDCLWTRN